jgi:uncharacterized membrane protein
MQMVNTTDENQNVEVTLDDPVEMAEDDIEELKQNTRANHTPPATFKGNAYDLTSLVAVLSGIGILFLCLTCNMGFYLMPFVAIFLGIVGVFMAQKSINPQRTQLLSWLGIGSGLAVILISVIGITLYILLLILLMRNTGYGQY